MRPIDLERAQIMELALSMCLLLPQILQSASMLLFVAFSSTMAFES